MAKAQKKAEVVEAEVVDVEPRPLEGTPVVSPDPLPPVGVPVFDTAIPSEEPGSDADIGVPLDATPSETVVHDTTADSARPEDGAAA